MRVLWESEIPSGMENPYELGTLLEMEMLLEIQRLFLMMSTLAMSLVSKL